MGHVRQQFFDEEVIDINWGVGDLDRFGNVGCQKEFTDNFCNTLSRHNPNENEIDSFGRAFLDSLRSASNDEPD